MAPAGDRGLLSLGVTWVVLIIVGIVLLSAIAGFVSWYFTRFVIDDDEIRVETGALFRNSRRVAFERVQSVDLVQPLAPRGCSAWPSCGSRPAPAAAASPCAI